MIIKAFLPGYIQTPVVTNDLHVLILLRHLWATVKANQQMKYHCECNLLETLQNIYFKKFRG